jgi:hypothetical protein
MYIQYVTLSFNSLLNHHQSKFNFTLNDNHDIAHISPSTVNRVLHQQGMDAMHMINKPMLTREHVRNRLELTLAHRGWTVEQWKQVIFSDETVITARSSHEHKIK